MKIGKLKENGLLIKTKGKILSSKTRKGKGGRKSFFSRRNKSREVKIRDFNLNPDSLFGFPIYKCFNFMVCFYIILLMIDIATNQVKMRTSHKISTIYLNKDRKFQLELLVIIFKFKICKQPMLNSAHAHTTYTQIIKYNQIHII